MSTFHIILSSWLFVCPKFIKFGGELTKFRQKQYGKFLFGIFCR